MGRSTNHMSYEASVVFVANMSLCDLLSVIHFMVNVLSLWPLIFTRECHREDFNGVRV